jgi:putative nucleotidyltransferase with HDIG domain
MTPSPGVSPMPLPFAVDWLPLVYDIQTALQPVLSEVDVYLVGGAVRDALFRRPIKDLDFVTSGDGRKVAKRIANKFDGAYYPLDEERQVGRAIIEYEGSKYTVDVAAFRGETLEADLRARDFALNAIAVPMTDLTTMIDPLNGVQDINKKRLRLCSPTSISDDPIRALRGVRQSVAFNLLMEPDTRHALRADGQRIFETSVERVRDEFFAILNTPRPQVAMRVLDALGMLAILVPETQAMKGVEQTAPHIHDVWEHTLAVMESLDGVLHTISPHRTSDSAADTAQGIIVYTLDKYRRRLQDHLSAPLANGRTVRSLLMYSALMHDIAKPRTRSVGGDGRVHFYQHEVVGADIAEERAIALKLSNEEVARHVAAVRNHMRPMHLHNVSTISRRAIYRFWRSAGEAAGIDVCILTLADYLGMVGSHLVVQEWIRHIQTVDPLLDGMFNLREQVVSPPPLIRGQELMDALNLKPGKTVGNLIRLIAEEQAAGKISTPDEALEYARRALKKMR